MGPAEIVTDAYNRSVELAENAKGQMTSFLTALDGSVYTAPSVSVSWATLGAPVIPPVADPPTINITPYTEPSPQPRKDVTPLEPLAIEGFADAPPPIITRVLPTLNLGTVPAIPAVANIPVPAAPMVVFGAAPTLPTPANVPVPVAPAVNFGVMPALPAVANIPVPSAPSVHFGSAPTLPALANVQVPTAPTVNLPALPTMLSLSTHSFGGIDLHEDWLGRLDTIPELSLLQPTKLQYARGAEYTSQLLSTLKASLNARLGGGTGLSPAVEQAMWARARDREVRIALAAEQETMRTAESFGFPIPSGAVIGALADARREYHDKLSGLSRDITIKQAELEQANLKDAISAAVQLESKLIDYSFQIEQLVFQASKALADNEIQTFNANIEHFKALLSAYQSYASVYDTLIKSELSKIEVFKAKVSAEQAKVQINLALVQQYKAEVEGSMAVVEVFKAQVGAAQALVNIEQTKMQTAGEQIKAFVATTNAEMAKVEIFKAQVGATQALVNIEQTKMQTAGEQIKAFVATTNVEVAKMDVYKAQVGAAQALVGMEQTKMQTAGEQIKAFVATTNAEMAKVEVYKAQVGAVQAQIGVEQTKIQAAGEQIKAFAANANAEAAKVDAYKAQIGADVAQIEGYKARTQAYAARASAQGDIAKIHVARYQAESASLASQWAAWSAQVTAKGIEVDASGKAAAALVEGYKISAVAAQAHAEVNAKVWEAQLKQYEAGKSLVLQAAKINSDALMHANDARMEAAKVGAQVMSQQTASAFNIVNTTASISGSVTQSI